MSTKEAGEQILADLMGSAYLAQKAAQRNSFNEVLQDYSAEVCFAWCGHARVSIGSSAA